MPESLIALLDWRSACAEWEMREGKLACTCPRKRESLMLKRSPAGRERREPYKTDELDVCVSKFAPIDPIMSPYQHTIPRANKRRIENFWPCASQVQVFGTIWQPVNRVIKVLAKS